MEGNFRNSVVRQPLTRKCWPNRGWQPRGEHYGYATKQNKINKYLTRSQRIRPGPNTDSQGGSLGEITEHVEPVKQQIAGSKGLNKTKPEECQVCKKRFKSERGVRIHQGKSGCKSVLGLNRIKMSKPVVGDIQESHHRDFSCTIKPELAANTSRNEDLDTYSESSGKTEITLTQDISNKLKELRGVLVIDDQYESDIQHSILVEEAEYRDSRKKRACEQKILVIENDRENEIRESVLTLEEESDTSEDHTAPTSPEENSSKERKAITEKEKESLYDSDEDLIELTKRMNEIDITDVRHDLNLIG